MVLSVITDIGGLLHSLSQTVILEMGSSQGAAHSDRREITTYMKENLLPQESHICPDMKIPLRNGHYIHTRKKKEI